MHIGIGNSDNRLSQAEWSEFCHATLALLTVFAKRHHNDGARLVGAWYSEPSTPWQSAQFAVTLPRRGRVDSAATLRHALCVLAGSYRQDSIAFAFAPITEFLGPADPDPPPP